MKKTAKRIVSLLLLVGLLCMALPAFAANSYMYATDDVNLRYGPGTNYGIITWIPEGTQVVKTGSSGNWYEIYYLGQTGYVSKNYMSASQSSGDTGFSPSTGSGTKLYVTTGLNVRAGAGTKYKLIGALSKGSTVTVISKSGNWSKIYYQDGTGYVYSKYLASSYTNGSCYTGACGYMYATTQTNVRTGPGTGYEKLGWLEKGERVYVTGKSGSWYVVCYNGQTAYVAASNLSGTAYYGSSCGNSCNNSCGNSYCGYCGSYYCDGSCRGNGSTQSFNSKRGYAITKNGGMAYYATSTNSQAAVYLEADTVIYYTGYNSNWVRFVSGGNTMYVPASVVSFITSYY